MRMFALELSSADVFQILDALDSRAEAWEYTSRQLSGTLNPDDEFRVPEECSDFSEAERIARHFRDIGVTLRSQIERQ